MDVVIHVVKSTRWILAHVQVEWSWMVQTKHALVSIIHTIVKVWIFVHICWTFWHFQWNFFLTNFSVKKHKKKCFFFLNFSLKTKCIYGCHFNSDTNECASSSTNVCKAANFVVCANTNGSYVCNCLNNSYVKSQESVCVGK